MRFLTKTIRRHGKPETITIDGNEANAAAIKGHTKRSAQRSATAR
jgi:transposase-like protein